MSDPLPASFEALLAHNAWVRKLAQRLIADSSRRDDLVQEVWLAALERGHPVEEPSRSWLAGVLRNLVRRERRSDVRRHRREVAVARHEASHDSDPALAGFLGHRDIVEAVLALDEPYRTTIVLRFFEALPPRRIARRLGVPVETVKTRLTRGLQRLRERLDRDHGGDGRSWAIALFPLARPKAGPALPTFGVLTVNTILKVAVGSALTVGLIAWHRFQRDVPMAPKAQELATPEVASAVLPKPDKSSPTQPTSARQEAELAAATEPPSTRELATLFGRVADLEGRPVGAVPLALRRGNSVRMYRDVVALGWDGALEDAQGLGASTSGGAFEFEVESKAGCIVTDSTEWVTVHPGRRAGPTGSHLVLVAPRLTLEGHVVDPSGAPLPDVELVFLLPAEHDLTMEALFGREFESSDQREYWATRSDPDGRFRFPAVPDVAGAFLGTHHPAHQPKDVSDEIWRASAPHIILEPIAGETLEGIVVDENENPIADATVAQGYRAVKSGEDGRFRLTLVDVSPNDGITLEAAAQVTAIAPGRLPVQFTAGRNELGELLWPDSVTLQLAGEPLELAGHVLDDEGEPIVGVEVWVMDATTLYTNSTGLPILSETLASGTAGITLRVATDAAGRFRFTGLAPRDYELRAVDQRTAQQVDAGAFAAGREDVSITISSLDRYPTLRGVVVSKGGIPLEGADIYIETIAYIARSPNGNGVLFNTSTIRTLSGPNGAFALEAVPHNGELVVCHSSAKCKTIDLSAIEDPDDVLIVLSREVRLRITLTDSESVDGFAIVDSHGSFQELSVQRDGSTYIAARHTIQDGQTGIVSVSEEGTSVVLYRGEDEVDRLPVNLSHAPAAGVLELEY